MSRLDVLHHLIDVAAGRRNLSQADADDLHAQVDAGDSDQADETAETEADPTVTQASPPAATA